MRSSPRLAMSMWDNPAFEHNPLTRYWKRMMKRSGETLTSHSIPRHIHGYIESSNPRTECLVRWFPYKQQMTVDGRYVPTLGDIIYTHYFPKQLDDDQRVKYVALKTNRSELEVAEELFLMRKMKLFVSQLLRNKLQNRPLRMPDGVDYSGIERRYTLGIAKVAQAMGMSMYRSQSYDPTVVYSPYLDFGDCIDCVCTKQLRTSSQYLLCEVAVHRGIARSRLTDVTEDPKEPLSHLEPSLYEFVKLRLGILAVAAKQEHYVVDHMFDGGHRYGGCLIHLFPSPLDPEIIDHEVEHIELDLDLARRWMKHYYDHYVAPRRSGLA
ncbi:hypothetical protein, conserved [Trypanosoma brucei gambiense DAL972]|uniref:Uncharacterized protein n=3 Tax=Trypanosoma brucei TaxID=5691 RepID=Q587D6_TRYB2|nr:hypothetical protein, conserved [Trypanosoma brucei gambiense DAL972]XP_845587.1 hypothetical protein, conserved [Trypanosoma brucei brucei TREU927]AAX79241.1 hypothetical protein, conserved [Trypanosoma brucei]RHW71869.1 hypothetical protein DPX39_060051100 [Trypanosoma brucei equiperdum]AAZ12028.1 hypothetical protein, conserved [Trypanosoma brucei brucei TREU927]CBH11974.1 hypothetical protein, conserved [Trypanosoma brucei gambiense DAL972]|eukprot:XP_011774259.1 hypothetical protein, conserved [Trypanosoma brucei gambiense DAL972]